ncbi:MAG: hypothetical protein M0R40_00100 [Firmicutes bacterium]|nr:hypothetical protein [Bacillota bacterium]
MHIKRLTLILLVIFIFGNHTSFAATLEEAVSVVSQKLFIETKVDKNILRLYSDWGFIDSKYIDVFAGALHSGLLSPKGKLLKPKGGDFSALLQGLIRFSIISPTFEIEGFYGSEQRQFTPDTVFIVDDEIQSELEPEESAYYYALVNKGGRTYVVWKTKHQNALWLYSGNLYLKEGDNYILQNLQKKNFGSWQSVSENDYESVVMAPNVQPLYNNSVIDGDINLLHLDKQVFILGQPYDEKIKAYHFEVK